MTQDLIASLPTGSAGRGRGVSVGMVSTFPPTSCGLATFAAALGRGMLRTGASSVGVVRCLQDGDVPEASVPGVHWTPGDTRNLPAVSRFLDSHDVVVLQHEYGIFGESDGRAVLDLLDAISVPVITTLHTVPAEPSAHQRRVLEAVVGRSAASVVMTETARRRLVDGFTVDPALIRNIPHGATRPPAVAAQGQSSRYVLTWGLLGPGKGIEWVVDALAMAPLAGTGVEYRVVGRTHPKVADRDGDAYLDMLKRKARVLGVDRAVTFDTSYHPLAHLLDIVARASLVVLPYESTDQVTSGVLVDAITAGVPVVATGFPHAEELLADGAGIVVPYRDPEALAEAIHLVMSDEPRRHRMVERAELLAQSHDWDTVSTAYLNLVAEHIGRGDRLLIGERGA